MLPLLTMGELRATDVVPAPRVARPVPASAPGLVVETFAVTLAVIALVWLGWLALWLLEQRW